MPTAVNTATLLPGRSYDVAAIGLTSLTRRYQVLRDRRSSIETLEVSTVTGLPAMGSVHPNHAQLFVVGYRVTEDDNGMRWVIEVNYSTVELKRDWLNSPPRGSAETSRGWESQDISIDLTSDALTGAPVLNAAGDPFESVPQISRSMPVFKLVKRSNSSVSSQLSHSGKYNSAAMTVDGVAIPKHAGRLTVSHRKLYLDPDGYTSEFTYTLTVMENVVKIDGSNVDIGWDKAIVEAGLFYLDVTEETDKLRAMEQDQETKAWRPRDTPVLLAADGQKLGAGLDPVIKVVATMPESSFSSLLA